MKTKDKVISGLLFGLASLAALSFYLGCKKSKGEITGDFKRDVIDNVSASAQYYLEQGKDAIHEPVKEAGNVIQETIPVAKELVNTTAQAVKPSYQVDTKSVPCGTFEVDLMAFSGENKRFSFRIKGKEKSGELRVYCSEYASKESDIGGNARFNVVFWDADKKSQKGQGFLLDFGRSKGVLIRAFDASKQTVYITNGQHVTAQLSYKSNRIIFSDIGLQFNNAETLSESDRLIKARPISINSMIRKKNAAYGVPLEVKPTQMLRGRQRS